MYTPLYNARGVLTTALRRDSSVLFVDSGLRSVLAALSYNSTYLRITGKCAVEIIKVIGVDATGVYIRRGQDNTEAEVFNAGDIVEYTLTASEIQDWVAFRPLQLYGAGAIDVTGTVVSEIPLNITFEGVDELVGEAYLRIGRKEGAYGGCTGNNGAAVVPTRPIYLTSVLYPIYAEERLLVDTEFAHGLMWNPSTEAMAVGTYIAGLDMVVMIAYRTYAHPANPVESVGVSGYISNLDIVVTVAYRTYASPSSAVESIKVGDSYITALDLPVVVAYRTYSYYAPEGVTVASQITGLTLT